jgi:uncharacterized membrane protein YbhN (UPF0104 family)
MAGAPAKDRPSRWRPLLRRPERQQPDEDMPRVHITREQTIALVLFTLSALAFLYFVLPKLAGLKQSVHRVEHGSLGWLLLAAAFEIASFVGYIVLFHTVFARRDQDSRIDWNASYQISLAGLAATRLFAAAGAGGIALTAWALRRSGMEPRVVACRLVAFNIILYTVYGVSLVVDGIALRTGAFPGGGSFAITIVPAIFGALALTVVYSVVLVPAGTARLAGRAARGEHRRHALLARLALVPELAGSGARTAVEMLRGRDWRLLGALAWWGFDICTLWACFHAFGTPPPFSVLWMAYFVGMIANLLPLPGGIGGVDGGMIGALLAFGVQTDLAVVSVLAYRALAFWLPTIPGAIAYLQLRRTVRRWREEPRGAGADTIGLPARV